jgi:hypothetical protein
MSPKKRVVNAALRHISHFFQRSAIQNADFKKRGLSKQ